MTSLKPPSSGESSAASVLGESAALDAGAAASEDALAPTLAHAAAGTALPNAHHARAYTRHFDVIDALQQLKTSTAQSTPCAK
jgi:hypothetical protein